MKQTQVSTHFAMPCAFALAFAMLISGVQATAQGASPKKLVKHVLNASYYDASSSGANASCGSAGCVAKANIYTESISCPGAKGAKCTYEVNIAALTSVGQDGGNGNAGLYQFLIDNKIPTGGGTDQNGFYTWGTAGGPPASSSYSVTSQVTNTSANQSHSIVVNIGCSAGSDNSGGCNASSAFASLTLRVLTP
jgi:hypothetical protein